MSKRMTRPARSPAETPAPVIAASEGFDNSFASVLRAAMRNKGLSAADLSRAIQKEIPAFSPGNISHYLAGRSIPRTQVLNVISQMLDVGLQEYTLMERKLSRISYSEETDSLGNLSALSVSDAGDGQAFVQINQTVPWSIAIEILKIFRGENEKS
ncbi:helix-turn-helix domain-containing protein [Methylobacterium trifolii]|uniref:helix-turn-helix domain-containing protein n=1 Tax=Methylobacterium trifolii TaxID=1003092 RepID=UPI001EDE60E2|nr:helix-turn-helix domain-containing protein [Methylobacterium trifolii]